jgi:hypothetical protein
MSKEAIPNPVSGRMVGEVVGAINYFGSFVKIELCNLAGERAYFRLLYCRWKFYDGDQDLLDSETCDFNESTSLNFIIGRSIIKMEIHGGRELWISFDGGELLIARPDLTNYEMQDDIAAFVIDETIYSLSPRMTFYVGESDRPH